LTNCVRLPGEYFFGNVARLPRRFQRSSCRRGSVADFYQRFDRLIGETNCRLASLAGTRLLGQRVKMKVKPSQWDSAVEFWPWGNFNLEFLASFGGQSRLRVFGLVLSLLV